MRCSVFQWLLSQSINAFDDVKFEAASVVAELYQQQNQSNLAKPILRKAVELSQHNIYWHCRLIFQLAVRFLFINIQPPPPPNPVYDK